MLRLRIRNRKFFARHRVDQRQDSRRGIDDSQHADRRRTQLAASENSLQRACRRFHSQRDRRLEEEVRRVAGESITNAGDSTRLKEFEMPLHVTETAAREIDTIIQQQGLDAGKICLRVGVKGGGCSGFSYILDLTEVQKDSDECWSYSYGRRAAKAGANEGAGSVAVATAVAESAGEPFTVRVVCDPKSYLYLNGTTIDFKDEIMGRGFVFNNPNATTSCGCGSSFSA